MRCTANSSLVDRIPGSVLHDVFCHHRLLNSLSRRKRIGVRCVSISHMHARQFEQSLQERGFLGSRTHVLQQLVASWRVCHKDCKCGKRGHQRIVSLTTLQILSQQMIQSSPCLSLCV
jgi:hypothetical protein